MPGGKPVTEMPGLRPRSPAMADTPALVTVEAASTANALEAPRFGATSVLTIMVLDESTTGFLDTTLECGGLDARTVVARTTASDSIARLRIPVFMNFSCLKL
jgi:hypothetical protein